MSVDRRRAPTWLLLSGLAAIVYAVAGRPGPLGGLVVAAAALMHVAAWTSTSRASAGLATATAALGPASVAVAPIAPLAPVATIPLTVAVAASFALVGLVAGSGRPAARRFGTVAARAGHATRVTLGWCSVEALWARPSLLGDAALPVVAIGSALTDGPLLVVASWLGVGGLSLLALTLGGVVAASPFATLAVIATATVGLAYGDGDEGTRRPASPSGPSEVVRLRLVQHAPTPVSIALVRFDPGAAHDQLRFLEEHAGHADGRLVVLPEALLPSPLRMDGDPAAPTTRPSGLPSAADVLFGTATVRPEGTFNSALLWSDAAIRIVADKRRLVPLTEAALTRGEPRAATSWRGLRIAAAICWEAAFPSVARGAAREGATFLALLANDAYAGTGPVGRLHLRMARLRAAESGLPIAFVQATGPSAAIAADGRVVGMLDAGRRGSIDVDLPIAGVRTPFRRTGDLVGPVSLVASLASLLSLGLAGRGSGRLGRKGGEA